LLNTAVCSIAHSSGASRLALAHRTAQPGGGAAAAGAGAAGSAAAGAAAGAGVAGTLWAVRGAAALALGAGAC